MQNAKFRKLIKKVNVYPPCLGMRIPMRSFSDDFTWFEVGLRERWYNRNLFGTHFEADLLNAENVAFARVSKEAYLRLKEKRA